MAAAACKCSLAMWVPIATAPRFLHVISGTCISRRRTVSTRYINFIASRVQRRHLEMHGEWNCAVVPCIVGGKSAQPVSARNTLRQISCVLQASLCCHHYSCTGLNAVDACRESVVRCHGETKLPTMFSEIVTSTRGSSPMTRRTCFGYGLVDV